MQFPPGNPERASLHVRAAAGLFDVSHMGQFEFRATVDVARALESVTPADIAGRQRYALLTNEPGGIRNLGNRFAIVANAACKDADEAYLARGLVSKLARSGAARRSGLCSRCKGLRRRPRWPWSHPR